MLLFFAAADAQQNKGDEDSVVEAPVTDDQVMEEKASDTLFVDTTLNYNKPFVAADSVKAWKELKEFAYVKNMDSLLAAAKRNKPQKQETTEQPRDTSGNWLERLFSSKGLQFFFWALAILFVLFILYKLFLTEGVFRKKSTSVKPNTPEAEEEIISNESDLAIMIRQAVQSGNYRLAIRYQYLQTLFKLSAKNLIEMAADKTNNQYVREITNANYQNDFAALTLNYEYVWYGEFAIDENVYRRLEAGFSQFNNKL
ncbi:DUF4129 domain-containing protein [Ferruginibacter sp. SUN106]|uniref:DUF4129 domain-containing protein n=1 Tax=Ferruginibacter sp. SUN106 TaxID=2978348 RepID=UPI003D36A71C